jgi:hypothetical protein
VTVDQYWARIKWRGLSAINRWRGQYRYHVWRDGEVYPIRDPEDLTDEQRVEQIRRYEADFPDS